MKIYPISILCSTLPIYLSVLCEVFYKFPRQAWLYLPLHFHTIWIVLLTEEITLCYNYEFILPSRSSLHSKDCVFSNILCILKIHSFFQAYVHSLTKYLLSNYYVSLFSVLAVQGLKKQVSSLLSWRREAINK